MGGVTLFLLVPLLLMGREPPRPSGRPEERIDISQATLMLDLLDAVSSGGSPEAFLDPLMEAEGTGLLIAQMNLVRRVSPDQYRQLLRGLMNGSEPQIQPVDSTRSAQRGVDGLLLDVWPALEWGLAHTAELRDRIRHLGELDLSRSAGRLANRFLPVPVEGSARVFAVMGGRAGAATVGGNQLYLDVLVYSYRGRRTGAFPGDTELTRTVAHELHHMGYQPYLRELARRMDLSDGESLQFSFLTGLMTEGSATYLISEERNLSRMRANRSYAEHLEHPEELLSRTEEILQAIQDRRIRTRADYEEATADLVGSWFHSAGSLLLSAIDQASGLGGIERVIADPRRLLSAFNDAIAELGPAAPARPFDPGVVAATAAIGGGRRIEPRRQEIGIRMALGAKRTGVLRMVVAQAAAPALSGLAVGLGTALLAGRVFERFLFEVSPRDPAVLGGVSGILLVVAVVSAVAPARSASRVSPADAFREE